jgi:starch synthase
MAKVKVLIVTQEMKPYTALSEISEIARKLPQAAMEQGMEIRILMPRYGTINERRHRLHEVVRLSGMNIIVDNDDYPLIIKVASLPGARMQVYFLDNEDFFKRKSVFEDAEGKPFADNPDRMAFFCKGVLETVKKFGWPPDIVHCHGWMTSLIPLYIRTAYKNDPLFTNSKIIYSLYNNSLEKTFTDHFLQKASINNLTTDDLAAYKAEDGSISLQKGGSTYADGLIVGSDSFADDVVESFNNFNKPILNNHNEESYLGDYINFYKELIG